MPPSEGISNRSPSGDEDNWTFKHSREGMDFAIVSGKSVAMNGSEDDRDEVESLRKKIYGDFIWFIHNGESYIIRDAATVKAARELYSPMEELGRKQEALGKQQEATDRGRRQATGQRKNTFRAVDDSDLGGRQPEAGPACREHNVAAHGELDCATDAGPVDDADHWQRTVLDGDDELSEQVLNSGRSP